MKCNVLSSETRYSVLNFSNVITKESCKYVHRDDNMHLKPASASGQVVGIKVESRLGKDGVLISCFWLYSC